MAARENWSLQEAQVRCAEQDSTRERFLRYFFGEAPFRPAYYDLVFNTARVHLEDVAGCVAFLVEGTAEAPPADTGAAVLTLSREMGAADDRFVAAHAARLGLQVHDRDLLEQEAVRLGVSAAEVEKVDEQPAGFFGRLRSPGLSQRYFEVLRQIMAELAGRGNVLLVGRGGNRVLRDHPGAFHVRLVASLRDRLRQIMQQHWLREEPARQLISDSDEQRRRFHANHFGADWANPLEYHLTLNTARLGPAALDVIALMRARVSAER
jgi:cytidylate kinase